MADEPNELDVLRAFVSAHNERHPHTGDRVPIMFLRFMGGSSLQHHGLEDLPDGVDAAMLEDMHGKGLITIDYLEHGWNITPTAYAREVIAETDRINNEEPSTNTEPVLEAISSQAASANPLAWPAVRPVLVALRNYWTASGYSQHGVQLRPIASAISDDSTGLFAATIRALIQGGYLAATGSLSITVRNDQRIVTQLPGEVALTEKAHAIVDGWPGAAPEELVDNLLAVIAATAASEHDPTRRRRLEILGSTIRETGVAITSEVISKVLLGGLN